MKRLIVNADDYGRTASISRGIRYAHLHGIVTTTTAMMNHPAALSDVRAATAECPALGLGVHLTLTSGRPLRSPAQVPSLVNSEGGFLTLEQFTSASTRVSPAEVRAEWRAQIELFLTTGATLDHLDSHHHTSYFTEETFGIMLDLAKEYDVPVRRPHDSATAPQSPGFAQRLLREKKCQTTDYFIASFYDTGATLANLLNILSALPDGLTEIMSHPGYIDDEILSGSSYNRQREQEILALTDSEVRHALQASQIALATFRTALQPVGGRPG